LVERPGTTVSASQLHRRALASLLYSQKPETAIVHSFERLWAPYSTSKDLSRDDVEHCFKAYRILPPDKHVPSWACLGEVEDAVARAATWAAKPLEVLLGASDEEKYVSFGTLTSRIRAKRRDLLELWRSAKPVELSPSLEERWKATQTMLVWAPVGAVTARDRKSDTVRDADRGDPVVFNEHVILANLSLLSTVRDLASLALAQRWNFSHIVELA
jgi:hypothetical protein